MCYLADVRDDPSCACKVHRPVHLAAQAAVPWRVQLAYVDRLQFVCSVGAGMLESLHSEQRTGTFTMCSFEGRKQCCQWRPQSQIHFCKQWPEARPECVNGSFGMADSSEETS